MANDLRANFARPEQEICQRITNLVFRQLGHLRDLFLSMCAAANGLAHAVSRGELSQHPRNAPRGKRSFVIERHPHTVGANRAAVFSSGFLVFPQSLST